MSYALEGANQVCALEILVELVFVNQQTIVNEP